ncbi:hypothetical protein MOO44_00330 (plasmid) [Nicoliella spurrieriana]|uniref:Uncharacterized protein n=1 Tax=Nicoliella spurrieriana TaxID=2925830 RepID=A0A976RQY2_9LACO|nr:hypothetical protein [Nicoliella spurrieriana]UQS86125.1 hypothetical protein MOO44_00330 [Nicoliella spurrieriana]
MSIVVALTIVMMFLFIGEWVSTLSKAYIPSVFVTAVLFLIGYWTIIPKNITEIASFTPNFVEVIQAALLIHMGTLMDLKVLVDQWRSVVVALSGVLGTVILAMGGGLLLFNWHTVIASVPPLTGGIVAAFLMSNGLKAQHITELISFPVSMFVVHSIIGYPLTAFLLKKEGKRLLGVYRSGNKGEVKESVDAHEVVKSLTTNQRFSAYKTPAFQIFLVMLLSALSLWIGGTLLNNVINKFIVCLVVGVVAHQFGILDDHVLEKAGVFNWFMYGLLLYIFSFLAAVTPQNLTSILVPIITMIILGIFGMFLASFLLAKPLGMSKSMAFASALTALFGFPADYIVTHESAKNIAKTKDEETFVLNHTLPKMLVGGFATVSVASVIIASIFLKLL